MSDLVEIFSVSRKTLYNWFTAWETRGVEVSQKTVTRVLKGLQMSWHRLRRVVGGQPGAQEYQEKQAQLEQLKQLDEAGEIDLYYLDETGFCLIP